MSYKSVLECATRVSIRLIIVELAQYGRPGNELQMGYVEEEKEEFRESLEDSARAMPCINRSGCEWIHWGRK